MMKIQIALLLLIFIAGSALPAFSATVTCEVQDVSDDRIILKNCDERAKGFEKGSKVKVKLQKKGKK